MAYYVPRLKNWGHTSPLPPPNCAHASVNLKFELLYETFHAVLEDHAPLINPSQNSNNYLTNHG